MGKWKRLVKDLGVLIAMTLLASCGTMIPILSTDAELILENDQKWSMHYVVVLPAEAGLYAQLYQTTLDQTVLEMRSKGVTASWELLPRQAEETNISYKMNFSGTGYENLNQYILEKPSAITVDPSTNSQVTFTYDPRDSLFSQGENNTFILRGTKILSSNGDLIDRGSVQWSNPTTTMTAVLSTSPDLTWLWITLLGAGGMGSIIAGLGVSGKLPARRSRSSLAPPQPIPVPTPQPEGIKFCPQCGKQNPAGAGFCTHCGFQLP